jgi:hypothetical protein
LQNFLSVDGAATIRGLRRFTPMPNTPLSCQVNLVYFVHDLNDPAVARRLAMLQPYLASAIVIGFHRTAPVPMALAGWPVMDLGRTADGKLGRRALSVLRHLLRPQPLRAVMRGATLVIARQLEMLALAVTARRRYAKSAALVYECLDIHRMMLNLAVLRRVEAHLLRDVDRVIVSSPGFIDAYLKPVHGAALPPVSLIENKILRAELQDMQDLPARPEAPPWRIGWYGVLRCRRSLILLIDLTGRFPGRIIVELRGRPSRTAIPDFDTLLADTPYVTFRGEYDRRTDLAQMYKDVHFTWAIDFYESGQNSAWLLPNRLYEGGAHGAVPIADASVATGQWLARYNAGVLLREPIEARLHDYFATLNGLKYTLATAALAGVDASRWIDDGQDAADFIAAIRGCD